MVFFMFESILSLIREYPRIILHRHIKPDGDALGSQIGLAALLRHNYPDKEVYIVGDMTPRFSFMEGSVMDGIPDEAYQGALAILLDTATPSLLSDTRYHTATARARIDHHLFCGSMAPVEVIDSTYESCCGLVTSLAMEAGWELTPLAASSLFTGTVTDSGRFRYDAVTAGTFARVSFLMTMPLDTTAIYTQLYAEDLAKVQLRASYVGKIRLAAPHVAYIFTAKEELAATGMDAFSISRAMVNTMGDIRDVHIWVNFTESEEGILTELRSSLYNINPVAVKYGGGGHAKASGAVLSRREQMDAMLADLTALTL